MAGATDRTKAEAMDRIDAFFMLTSVEILETQKG
jgi:hypothetical protein